MSAQDAPRGYAELVTLARRRLRRLDVTPPLEPDALRRALEKERGTTITVVATDELPPGSAFAVTGRLDDREVVLHEARTTRSHQQLILLHEYAHMLLRHPPSQTLHAQPDVGAFHEIDAAVVAETLGLDAGPARPGTPPAAPPRRWSSLLRRRRGRPAEPVSGLYAEAAEQEAETLATILLGWVPGHAGHVPARPAGRLDEVLGEEGAW
ncbi:hypothetical protein [Pseudonocardia endophytica]|uniref:IrrE N-terminal-like domain-containing protein n=1 Tax=Pseudonocardia endophytica TaxID=401976 RepID=A0A4R1HMI4_PSEEN|nr:hypothetical protein [Pseudonocardia endophytica]TCK22351.1 hypothetical protein EV378_6353 [Pseudonocardia endophytica]